jgi:phosphoglycerate dehydrogenase-like enzyme
VFHVGLTRDFLRADGIPLFGDIGLSLLDRTPDVKYEFLAEDAPELSPGQVQGFDALLVLGPRITASTLAANDRLTLLARFGVGYDSVDVDACTAQGVLLTITPDGVRRPVASSVIAFLLALSHGLVAKDRLTRAGRWADRMDHIGVGLAGRVLGIVGLGNIGREVARLARPFDLRILASDPHVTPEQAAEAGAELVDLSTLLRTADFVSLNCALTAETRHLLDADRLALMKPTAFLINTARGAVVDQAALAAALRERRIRGAALDVFAREPIDPEDPILRLDNVIVSPHAICWTDESLREIGRSACASVLDVAAGRVPRHVVNPAVLSSPTLAAKLRRHGSARRAAGEP